MTYRVKLEVFEGPLDLLLHLIKKEEVDIYDIPVARITDEYLQYLNLLETMNLDVAGEYLVMAATLTHIKSRMLLPPSEDETEEPDEDSCHRRFAINRRRMRAGWSTFRTGENTVARAWRY